MENLNSNNISAIIGVLGSLLGVFLGFFLNQISRLGKIKVYQNFVTLKLLERDLTGGFVEVHYLTDKIDLLSIEVNVDFFNTSSLSPKIARDIKFVICGKEKRIEKKLKNENSRKYNKFFSTVDDLKNVNLAPREIQNYKVTLSSEDSFKEIVEGNWFVTFRNERDRLRKFKIENNKLKHI